jgi:DNA mismatch endonuclease, patch repair protein
MDTVDQATRSRIMASVKSKNTGLELLVFKGLHDKGVKFKKHYRQLTGTPDIVFPRQKVAVFIDGDFWHGYRYPAWRKKIKASFWRKKIETNRARDRRNFAALRRMGWKVVRVWGHEIKDDLPKAVSRIVTIAQRLQH